MGYLLTYVTPLLVMVFTDNVWVKIFCTILCVVSQTAILYIEKIHLDEQGMREYFRDRWNQIDIVMLAFNFVYLAYKFIRILLGDTYGFKVNLQDGDPRLIE
jgi:NhaP-type Na+/H+ or K+/H+ antiporter